MGRPSETVETDILSMEDIHTKGTLITTPLLQDSSTRAPTVATEVPTHRQISRWTSANLFKWMLDWLVVSTHLKNISQNWIISPNRGENKKSLKPPPSRRFPSQMLIFSINHVGTKKHERNEKDWNFWKTILPVTNIGPRACTPFGPQPKIAIFFARFANLPIQVRDRKSLKPARDSV